ncbi:MAG TPA: aminomethyl-transferring glycine dehydrogenase subunit GcvPB [Candidatus Limiplasma sp.]|nr:aminomethyl-transferring glycine dehydrogenase subunit GcvPB [Candidatus Limiplasma sp.]
MSKESVLSFEKSRPGRGTAVIPAPDVPVYTLPVKRSTPPVLPEMAECDVDRHYTELAQKTFGVNCGFYPLGSCTMKYNPAVNEAAAALPAFQNAHPLAPKQAVEGSYKVMEELKQGLCRITGMDAFTLQPAAGAHGELTGMLLIKAYLESKGEPHRTKMIVPDSAHGTNPASAAMAGFDVVSVKSRADGCVDLEALDALLSDDVAGMMMTNPNTLGLFEKDILLISEKIHKAGGLMYYDGANLNAILGITRPGDMGFDVVHLNLHKTFSTPHGGGGPGAGPVGVKACLMPFLPGTRSLGEVTKLQLKAFHGNFAVMVKALAYIKALGDEGLRDVAEHAVLNANYLKHRLTAAGYTAAIDRICMHEFVLTLEAIKTEFGVRALDVAKRMIDYGIHPPTMYFPLIVDEALMFEPTETENRETLDQAADALAAILAEVRRDPQSLSAAPHHAVIARPDEVKAARTPVLRWHAVADTQ